MCQKRNFFVRGALEAPLMVGLNANVFWNHKQAWVNAEIAFVQNNYCIQIR